MDIATISTLIGTGIAIITAVYAFLRNFKFDINAHMDRMENRLEKRMDEISEENKRMAEENKRVNMRMDGVYHILLKRTEMKP